MEVAANFCLLHAKLSKLGFDGWASVNEGDVMTGNPHTFAVLLRYLYRRFPTATASLLRKYDWFLIEADDVALGATTLRLLRAASAAAGLISATQFGQCKYAMAKINACHALLRLLRSLTATSHPSVAARATAIAAAGEPDVVAASRVRAVDVQLRIAERRRALNAAPRS